MNTATETKTMETITEACRAAGCRVFFPFVGRAPGHASFYGDLHSVLRALALLGVSRTNRRVVVGWEKMTRWDLSDVDGTMRGGVISTAELTGATLDYALTQPMACMAA